MQENCQKMKKSLIQLGFESFLYSTAKIQNPGFGYLPNLSLTSITLHITNTIVHWLWSTDSLEIMTLMDGSWGLQPKHLHLHLKWFYALVWERAEDWGWTQNHRFYDPYVAIHLSFEAYFIAGYLHITLFSKDSRGFD